MEAAFYEKLSNHTVRCGLCPHHCTIAAGHSGRCRTRYNQDGTLLASNYGQCTSLALDPIEKKPLYHFHRGQPILSLGSWGCNLACAFCQNWEISQASPSYEELTPQRVAQLASQLKDRHNIGVAYTYNEPGLWYEFIRDTAPLIHAAGLANVMVTNGFIEAEPLQQLLPLIDAWNIDLKSFSQDYYQRLCQGARDPVMATIRTAAASTHVEVTTLIVTGENDEPAEIEELAAWLASLNRHVPLHLSRYFPRYHMTAPPTPAGTLRRCAEAARKHLDHVYVGNISAEELQEGT